MPLLIGPLADPALRLRLAPGAVPAVPLAGRLAIPPLAGLAVGNWPVLRPGSATLPLWQAEWTPELRRYATIFDLGPLWHEGRELLGVVGQGHDAAPGPWQPALAGALAEWLLAQPAAQPAGELRHRLPMIATWVASRQRAMAETRALPQIGPEGQVRWESLSVAQPYADFFAVEIHALRQRRHDGEWSPPLRRAVFVSGDATVVLPWDPLRDRVMLIDQFRAGPAARGDAQPWLYETVAGRVDGGESPEAAARREAVEETGLAIRQLIAAPHHYPSPGALAEHIYLFVGIADLPDAAAGHGGLASEDEDIRSHLVARSELTRMAMAGEIRNGPLLTLALWLELNHARLRDETAGAAGLTRSAAAAGLPPSVGGV